MKEHYLFEVDPAKLPPELQSDAAMLRTSSQGKLVAFGYSVLEKQGYFGAATTMGANVRPLLTFSFLDYLMTLDLSGQTLIELGAGNSTLLFQTLFRAVSSYETDERWFDHLKAKLLKKVELNLCTTTELEAADISRATYDWMLVDFAGRRTQFIRNYFATQPLANLPSYVILDNSEWYRNGAAELAKVGYQEIPFFGMKTTQTWVSCTSLFVMRGKALPTLKAPLVTPDFVRNLSNFWDA